MKKSIILLLLLVYALSSTGASLHLHYCCGKLDDISLSSLEKNTCFTKSIDTNGCCDSKHIELKVKGDQETIAKWINIHKNVSTPIYIASYYLLVFTQKIPANEYATGPPEALSFIPLFIKNCVYRI